jgi:signal transduction protein with GAF and PtsI domain
MTDQTKSYFQSFREVVKVVNSSLELKEVLDILVRNVTSAMDLKACAVRLLAPKTRTLEVVASHGLSEGYVNKGPVDADRSIASAMKGETVIIRDARTDPQAQYPEAAVGEGIATIVSIPLKIRGRVIGVMRLYTAEPRDFVDEELQFAEAVGEVGAIAIENARMYEKIKKDYEAVMSDIHRFVGYRRSI